MFPRRQQRRDNFGVYLLAYHLMNNDYIPPVTLWTILFQVAVFLGFVPWISPDKTGEMCLLPSRILVHYEWLRLLASFVMHADDMHLYYNMVSFLWKGRRLEPRLGSTRFLMVLLVFGVSTSFTIVGLSYFTDEVLKLEGLQLMRQCAVGFSGVLFALKVLHTSYFPHEDSFLFGWMPIPSRYACWAELFLIQMVTPNASFVGHFAGILVGLLYTVGPLGYVVEFLERVVSDLLGRRYVPLTGHATGTTFGLFGAVGGVFGAIRRFLWGDSSADSAGFRRQPSAPPVNGYPNWGSGTVGGSRRDDYGQRRPNVEDYTGGVSEEEQLRRAMEESLQERSRGAVPNAPPYPESDNYANYGWR